MMSGKYICISCNLLVDLILNHRGKHNAVHSRELERRYDISGRALRRIMKDLRETKKHPICSGSIGYFYPATQEEIIETVARLKSSNRSYENLCNCLLSHGQNLGDINIFGGINHDDLPF